jgi:hypothetical protein
VIELVFAAILGQNLDPNTPSDREIARAATLTRQNYIAIERSEFAHKFDSLVLALRAFEDEYRKSNGMVWPKKQADQVDKAIRRLQATPAWKQFNGPKQNPELAKK